MTHGTQTFACEHTTRWLSANTQPLHARAHSQASLFETNMTTTLEAKTFGKDTRTRYNTYGHKTGDDVLRHFAQTLNENVRTHPTHARHERRHSDGADLVGRLTDETVEIGRVGGEEFGIALYNIGARGAYRVAERLRKEVQRTPFIAKDGTKINLTMSIGVTATTETVTTWDDLYQGADKALYQSKRNGRNRTTISSHGLAAVPHRADDNIVGHHYSFNPQYFNPRVLVCNQYASAV